jgi:hypothetical protein
LANQIFLARPKHRLFLGLKTAKGISPMISVAVRINIFILITLCLVGCGINYEVTGKVVDTTTRKPVEGAVVSVYWVRTKLQIPMGLPPNRAYY